MILLWEGPYEKTLEESYKRGERFPLFFWSRANVSTCIVVYMCSIMAALHCNDMERRPRKRGRYNTHRRDVSVQKPKSTVYRQNHKARQLDTAENDQSSEEINDALLESVLSNDSNDCDPTIRTQHFPDPSMSFSVSHYSPEELSPHEDNSDGSQSSPLDIDWSDSEGDGISSNYECDSFSDEEPEIESAVCGDNFSETNESPDNDPYVYPGSQLKLSESVLLILTLAVAHNLTL